MKVNLKTTINLNSYLAKNEAGHSIELSGEGNGMSPMESLLAAVAGCSTVDIAMILEKMKQDIHHIEVEVTGERKEKSPRYFTSIHLHFLITGIMKEKKVEQAIQSSLEKYCSVSKMLETMATITSSYSIIEPDLDPKT